MPFRTENTVHSKLKLTLLNVFQNVTFNVQDEEWWCWTCKETDTGKQSNFFCICLQILKCSTVCANLQHYAFHTLNLTWVRKECIYSQKTWYDILQPPSHSAAEESDRETLISLWFAFGCLKKKCWVVQFASSNIHINSLLRCRLALIGLPEVKRQGDDVLSPPMHKDTLDLFGWW